MLDQVREKKHTHYLLHLSEQYGEYEVTQKFMARINDAIGDEDEQMEAMLFCWRSFEPENWDSSMGGCWFDGNMAMLPAIQAYLTPEEVELYSNVLWAHDIEASGEEAA